MSSRIVYSQGSTTITLAAGEAIAIFTKGSAQLIQNVGYPNFPVTQAIVTTLSAGGFYTSSVFASGASLTLHNTGAAQVLYQVGTAPVITEFKVLRRQAAAVAVNATATLTVANILAGMVSSTTAAAVNATLPTGALLEAASDFDNDDSYDWSVINTGPNTFTLLVGTNHTIVGSAAVATGTSGAFRTRKISDGVFASYRIS